MHMKRIYALILSKPKHCTMVSSSNLICVYVVMKVDTCEKRKITNTISVKTDLEQVRWPGRGWMTMGHMSPGKT